MLLGVDPGLRHGALAFLAPEVGIIRFADIPVIGHEVDAANLAALIAPRGIEAAIVEQVSAMPKQGVTSTFRFGCSVGVVLGVLGALRIPVHRAPATLWKRHFRLTADKEAARALAIRMWPRQAADLRRKGDAGRAEAGLMALFLHTEIEAGRR